MNLSDTQLSERELVTAAQAGDRAAERAIYKRYNERVFNLVAYSIGDTVFAEDLTQTIFLKIFRALAGFRFESALSTWIYRIALNECLNHSRRSNPEYVPLDAILGSGQELDWHLPPDVEHQRNERQEIITQAVMELSPKLRAVVVLKYIEGLSYEAIAEVLECSAGTVASRLSRALSHLESRLRPLRKIL
ncbi:MAG: sigma-70 family RNA polymerase sigma factor [Acidobacteriota bacterium]